MHTAKPIENPTEMIEVSITYAGRRVNGPAVVSVLSIDRGAAEDPAEHGAAPGVGTGQPRPDQVEDARRLRRHDPLDVGLHDDGLDVDVLHQGVDVDPLDDRVDVDPPDDGVDVDPLEQGVDVDPLEHGVEVDLVEHVVELDRAHHRVDDGPDDSADAVRAGGHPTSLVRHHRLIG